MWFQRIHCSNFLYQLCSCRLFKRGGFYTVYLDTLNYCTVTSNINPHNSYIECTICSIPSLEAEQQEHTKSTWPSCNLEKLLLSVTHFWVKSFLIECIINMKSTMCYYDCTASLKPDISYIFRWVSWLQTAGTQTKTSDIVQMLEDTLLYCMHTMGKCWQKCQIYHTVDIKIIFRRQKITHQWANNFWTYSMH